MGLITTSTGVSLGVEIYRYWSKGLAAPFPVVVIGGI
tara:strand:+ start:3184 stop:3294 length:111 start_codon:yes stop_codon:yes gene_type:complete